MHVILLAGLLLGATSCDRASFWVGGPMLVPGEDSKVARVFAVSGAGLPDLGFLYLMESGTYYYDPATPSKPTAAERDARLKILEVDGASEARAVTALDDLPTPVSSADVIRRAGFTATPCPATKLDKTPG